VPMHQAHCESRVGLYSPEERARRDSTVWTLVQAILAPVQFLVFLISLVLVVRYLATGAGYDAATLSIIIKTALLYFSGDRASHDLPCCAVFRVAVAGCVDGCGLGRLCGLRRQCRPIYLEISARAFECACLPPGL